MKILSLLSTLLFAMPLWATEDLYPEIREVDPGLYAAKIPHRDDFGDRALYCVMEMVTFSNLPHWQKYAEVQNNPRAVGVGFSLRKPDGTRVQEGTLGDGSGHFKRVLNEADLYSTEVWVAYITTDSHIRHNDETLHYKADDLDAVNNFYQGTWVGDPEDAGNSFAKHIQMFVTVTSSKEALLTSHMGVAASVEGTMVRRPKGISLDLHSFAAKVMLKRNSARRFMIHAPVFAMERIMYTALPGHVFPLTREWFKKFNDEISDRGQDLFYAERDRQWHLGSQFAKESRGFAKELMDYVREHNPRISYTESSDRRGNWKKVFQIFEDDRDRLWLTVDDNNYKTYKWLWNGAFQPAGVTHYVLVNLKALADARPIEPIELSPVGESASAGAGSGGS
jgi:hypothetical protein